MKYLFRVLPVVIVFAIVVSCFAISVSASDGTTNFYNTNNLFLSRSSSQPIYSTLNLDQSTIEYHYSITMRNFDPSRTGGADVNFFIPGIFNTNVPVSLVGSFVASQALIDDGLYLEIFIGLESFIVRYSVRDGKCYFSIDLPPIEEPAFFIRFCFADIYEQESELSIMLLSCKAVFNGSTVVPRSQWTFSNGTSDVVGGSINGNLSNSVTAVEFFRSQSYSTDPLFDSSILPDQAHIARILCTLDVDLSAYNEPVYFTISYGTTTSCLVGLSLSDSNSVYRPFDISRSNFVDESVFQSANVNYPIEYNYYYNYLSGLSGSQTSNSINLVAITQYKEESIIDQETFVSDTVASLLDTSRGVITFPWDPSWGAPKLTCWILDSYGSRFQFSQNVFTLTFNDTYYSFSPDLSVLDESERLIYDAINNLNESFNSTVINESHITNELLGEFYSQFEDYSQDILYYLTQTQEKGNQVSSGTNDVLNSENAVHEQTSSILNDFSHGFRDFTESSGNLSWVNYSYGFQFVSHYLQGAFDGMGGWSVVFSMPLFYGIFFFIVGHVRTMVFIPRHNADVTDRKSIRK